MPRWPGLIVLALAACTGAPQAPEPRTETVFLIVRGWHTDIAIPAAVADRRLATLHAAFPGARYLVFGVGARGFVQTENTDILDMLLALLPNPTAMLVTGLTATPDIAFPPPADVTPVRLTPAGLARLSGFIADSFEYAPTHAPRLLAKGPYPGSLFYYATPTYSAVYTCNTWAAQALRAGRLPVRTTATLFAGDIAGQARLFTR